MFKAEDYTIEYCPWCDSEQIIYSHGVTACPNCGKPLAPCSVCIDENGDCNYATCPYGCTGGSDDAFKKITMPKITTREIEFGWEVL